MKKVIIAIATMVLFSTAAYAQSVDLTGDVSNGKNVTVNLESGYYDLTAVCKNTPVESCAYLYGTSGNRTASTVLPVSSDGVTVTVRGINVVDGKCKIGVEADGVSKIEISDVDISKSKPYSFIKGGDMTEVNYIESLGGVYRDKYGNKVDPFEYLAENGMNMARIRLSNTTGRGTGDGTYYLPEGFQDESDCLKLAKRAKDAGMGMQFTFNYSDYWSNGSRQIIPSEWVKQIKDEMGYDVKDADFLNSMTAEQRTQIQDKLEEILYDYTFDIMTKLKVQGTVPEYVSIGNEIRGGMLFPFANTYDANMNKDKFELVFDDDKNETEDIKCPKDWDGLVKFINAGYDAVKAVSADTKVIIHLDEGSKANKFTYYLDELDNRGAKYDVIGASYYPAWTDNNSETCRQFCNEISKKYNKDIMIMESGFNWNATRKDGYAGQLVESDVYKDIYSPTFEGHMGFIAELYNELKGVENGRCLGVLYWDPCMIHVEDKNGNSLSGWAYRESDNNVDVNVVENTTLFDFNGKAIPTVDVFKNSMNSEQRIGIEVENNSSKTKKATLVVVSYDKDNIMQSVKNISTTVEPNSKTIISYAPSNDNKYTLYLWDGEKIERIEK